MASSQRLLARSASAIRSHNAATLQYAFVRQSSNSTPYPFTKDQPSKPNTGAPTSPYPFTKPSQETKPVPPTRPTERPGPMIDDSALISRQATEVADGAQKIDWDAHQIFDYRSSAFSPVPSRVMDGSEDVDTVPGAILSGAPVELQARSVRIYQEAKPATQSGDWHAHHWRMDWDILPKGHRWENPLMGWQSSADFMQGTHLNFASKEDAVDYAEKQGYQYFVQEPHERKFIPKAYATQFEHHKGKLKNIRTK